MPKNYKPLDEEVRIRPDSYYGVSKGFGEALGSYYSDYFDISSINIRIGFVISDDDPTFSPIGLNLWLSHRDLSQIIEKAINVSLNKEILEIEIPMAKKLRAHIK